MKNQSIQTEQEQTSARFTSRRLRGIMLPFPTPFEPDGDINLSGLCSNIEHWNRQGVAGYVALGSTGERVHLEEHECMTLIEAARAGIQQSSAFIVGAGQQSVRATASEVRRVAAAGADAVLVITPHFYRGAMTQEALEGYYTAVADASPVPVLLYSMPGLTGINIAPETTARLSEHENIIGIKDSSGDIINLAETIRLVRPGFAVLTGNGAVLSDALCAGAIGGILAAACVAPQLALAIYEAVLGGEMERAFSLQRKLTPLALAVTNRYGIGGLKAALSLLGLVGGSVRAPLREASEEARGEIARLIMESGLTDERAGGDSQYRLAGAAE